MILGFIAVGVVPTQLTFNGRIKANRLQEVNLYSEANTALGSKPLNGMNTTTSHEAPKEFGFSVQ